jgi:hypothetical protein
MKKVIMIFVFLIVFICAIFLGRYIYDKRNEIDNIYNNLTSSETQSNSQTNILQKGELNTMALFENEEGQSYYEVDLTANDMTWNNNTSLYYKIIDNMEDYSKYKSRITILPEMTANDFENNILVIVVNENVRSEDETDLTIYDVTTDETATHIIMKQKDEPNYNSQNNVFYAVVNKVELRENVDIEIE